MCRNAARLWTGESHGESGRAQAYDAANSPTLTLGVTRVGVILGTGQCRRSRPAVRPRTTGRSVWSFGAVLSEMLRGARALAPLRDHPDHPMVDQDNDI